MPHHNAHKIKKTTIKNNKQQNQQKRKFHAKTQYLNLKAPSNNFKMQADQNLNYTHLFFPNYTANKDFP